MLNGIFGKNIEVTSDKVVDIIKCACILHNSRYCERWGH